MALAASSTTRSPPKTSAPCWGASLRSSPSGQLAPTGQQVAGVKLPVGGDGVAFLQIEPPVVDAAGQVVPPLGVHAQGGRT